MERERRWWLLWEVELALVSRWEKAPERVGAGLGLVPVLPLATAAYEERRVYMAKMRW
jgi:hypothetical protein